jgi:hypothetical protein
MVSKQNGHGNGTSASPQPPSLYSLECDQEIWSLLSSSTKLSEKIINELQAIIYSDGGDDFQNQPAAIDVLIEEFFSKVGCDFYDDFQKQPAARTYHDSLVDVLIEEFFSKVGCDFYDDDVDVDKKLKLFWHYDEVESMSYLQWIEVGLILCGIKAGIHKAMLLSEKVIDPELMVWISLIRAPEEPVTKIWDWWFIPPVVTLSLYWLGIHDFVSLSQQQSILLGEHSFMNKEQARNIIQCNNDRLQLIVKHPAVNHLPFLAQHKDVHRLLTRMGGFSIQDQEIIIHMMREIIQVEAFHFGEFCEFIDFMDPNHNHQWYNIYKEIMQQEILQQFHLPVLQEESCRTLVRSIRSLKANYANLSGPERMDLFGCP